MSSPERGENGRGAHAIWRSLWFEPTAPTALSLGRIVLCGYLLWFNWKSSGIILASPFLEQIWRPVSFYVLLPIPSPEQLAALANVWKLSLALSCVGLFTRSSLATAFVLGVYVVGWRHNFGKVSHAQHVALLCLGVLAFSRAGLHLSLDALRRRRRGEAPPPALSSEYTWPVRVIWLVMTMMFFGAGVAKLRNAGLEWAFSDSFSKLLIHQHYHKGDLPGLGLWVAQIGWLSKAMATGSMFGEFLAPLAVVSRRARLILVPLLFSMQAGIALLMGTHVRSPNFAVYVFFIPWDWLRARLLPAQRGKST